jgi:hypothetical protein
MRIELVRIKKRPRLLQATALVLVKDIGCSGILEPRTRTEAESLLFVIAL